MSYEMSSLFRDVDAYIFDVFGTVVNLVGTIGTAIKEAKGDTEGNSLLISLSLEFKPKKRNRRTE
jgi:hypothetical protein